MVLEPTECDTPPYAYAYLITLVSTAGEAKDCEPMQARTRHANATVQHGPYSPICERFPSLLILFFHCPVTVTSTITITKRIEGHWSVVTYGQQKPFPDGYNALLVCMMNTSTILIGLATACTRAATFCARWHIKRSPSRMDLALCLHKKSTWSSIPYGMSGT